MTCPYVHYSDGGTAHCTLAETRRLPPHEHIRDELAAVIDIDSFRCDVDAVTVANRCVSVLVLLGVLPEVNDADPA